MNKDPVYIRIFQSYLTQPNSISFELIVNIKGFRCSFRFVNVSLKDIKNFVDNINKTEYVHFTTKYNGPNYTVDYNDEIQSISISGGTDGPNGYFDQEISYILIEKLRQLVNDKIKI